MNFPLLVARRYLFGRKSTNAINIITGISVLGIAIGTAALILILSVFNGFEGMMRDYLDRFNPDLKIESTQGKYFAISDQLNHQIKTISGVESASQVIEEVALLEYDNKQQVGIIKGVDQEYKRATDIVEAIDAGEAIFEPSSQEHFATIGRGIYTNLNISLRNQLMSLKVFLPNRKKKGALDKDFRSRPLSVTGVFRINNERDNQYVITDYEVVADLLALAGQASAIELRVSPEADAEDVKEELQKSLGSDYRVLNRYQQDESFLKIMNIEKWMSYVIFSFTLLLIIFNVIGCLWMIVLDKTRDISVLQSMGTPKSMIKKIFLYEGGLISLVGFGIGLALALIFYGLQKTVGIINVPDGYTISAYPMELEAVDVLLVFVTVMVLGLLASLPASWRAARVTTFVRVE